jgi:hypothetical protein
MSTVETTMAAERRRLLRFLAKGEARRGETATAGRLLLDGGDRGTIAVGQDAVARAGAAGLVLESGGRIEISDAGRLALKEAQGTGALGAQRQCLVQAIVDSGHGREEVVRNEAESPLAMLWRRKAADGTRFLTTREFRAGERLRSDYARGQLMPRMGVNWEFAGAGRKMRSGAGGVAELTDAALTARRRVESAVIAVGPELSGVLIDVCCFLKGLERVEAERGWPVRSAKVVLKSALGALARHYEPPAKSAATERPVLHWGAADYRPSIG